MQRSIIVLIVVMLPLPCSALTLREMADIFEAMESSILDVEIDYEWSNETQVTADDVRGTGHMFPVSKEVSSFTTAKPFAAQQLYRCQMELSTERNETFSVDQRYAYNGDVFKRLTIGALDERQPQGLITKRTDMIRDWTLTPMAFTILRDRKQGLLSQVLREHPEVVRLVDGIQQIRGFRTVELDFVTPAGDVHRKYFFSVDHGYAPVRFEWLSVPDGKIKAEVDVLEFKEVSPGVWFPAKGVTGHVNDLTRNVYELKEVKLNQNLSASHFDLEFQPGTAVIDEIAGVQYTYRPTDLQLNTWLSKDRDLSKVVVTHSAEDQVAQRQSSAEGQMTVHDGNDSSTGIEGVTSSGMYPVGIVLLVAVVVAGALSYRKFRGGR